MKETIASVEVLIQTSQGAIPFPACFMELPNLAALNPKMYVSLSTIADIGNVPRVFNTRMYQSIKMIDHSASLDWIVRLRILLIKKIHFVYLYREIQDTIFKRVLLLIKI